MAPDKRFIPTLTRTDYRTLTYIDEVHKDLFEDIYKKRDSFIKDQLSAKGFKHLIDGIENKIFPKVAIVKTDRIPGWSFVYADDGSEKPVFIIGLEDIKYTNPYEVEHSGFCSRITASFNYTDKEPNL